jgi:hypothetical protein
LHIATLNTGLDWSPGVTIEAESTGYTNRFHTNLPYSEQLSGNQQLDASLRSA